MQGASRSAALNLFVAVLLVGAKLAAALASGSVAVLSSALDSVLDVGAAAVALAAIRLAGKPPDAEHPWGHGRAENLAAFSQAIVISFVALALGWRAISLFGHPAAEPPVWVMAVIAGEAMLNTARTVVLRRQARKHSSQALAADAIHTQGDVFASVAVLAALFARQQGLENADPVAALFVVAFILYAALKLGRAAANILMDARTEELDESIAKAASEVVGVSQVSSVKVRSAGASTLAEVAVDVARTTTLAQTHDITEAVRDSIQSALPGTLAQVRVLPTTKGEDAITSVLAAASRVGIADQVHNVIPIESPDGMILLMHAKVDPQMSLEQAHRISDSLEDELRRELPNLQRVEIHLEPRDGSDIRGKVTPQEALEEAVKRAAFKHPPISSCHEVLVIETDHGVHVVAHCEAPIETPIAEIHRASLALEGEIHNLYGNLESVTVHFEPEEVD